MMTIELQLLKCSDIIVPNDYARDAIAQSNIADMSESITEHGGVISPILVYKSEGGTLTLLKGSRRLFGAIRNEIESIASLVLSNITEIEAAQLSATNHLSGTPLSPFEIASLLSKMQKSEDLSNNRIAVMIGWGNNDHGRQRVGNYLRLLRFPPDVIEFFKGPNALSITHSLQLQRLLAHPEYMVWVAEKITREGLSGGETSKAVDLALSSINPIEKKHEDKKSNSSDGPQLDVNYFEAVSSAIKVKFGCDLEVKQLKSGVITAKLSAENESLLKNLLNLLNDSITHY